jgi:1-acyl-sn-glycerol-3-phosphate acyltransferase
VNEDFQLFNFIVLPRVHRRPSPDGGSKPNGSWYTISAVPPSYRYSTRVAFFIVRDLLLGRRRSFVRDAADLSRGIEGFRIVGPPPAAPDPLLFLVNHYSRPGFRAWWISIGLGSTVGREMHWPMTSAWTFPDPVGSHLITPLTEWVLGRLARMYGFTLMPPMPPRPQDLAARADSVRRILRVARAGRPPMAMAPEGMDSPDGRLMQPPAGAGRFIAHLAQAGYTLVPVGAFEEGDSFCLNFGRAFGLPDPASPNSGARDRETIKIVMRAIAALLPERLRGIYS